MPARQISTSSYLTAFLKPFSFWLNEAEITEIMVNQPFEVWVERNGVQKMQRYDAPEITASLIENLATQIARVTNQSINRENPLLSAILENGERVQFIAPTATRGNWVMAIRRHMITALKLEDFATNISPATTLNEEWISENPLEFIRQAVKLKKTILISGGTSSGKTSFLNALMDEISDDERLVFVEDTPEIKMSKPNCVGLIAVKGEIGEARINTNDLLQASLRLRPDRIVLGELRGIEAVSFLRAINTGHEGSFSTIHANSPKGALDQLCLMVMQSGIGLSRDEIFDYAKSVIDIVVQLGKNNGQRGIAQIAISKNIL